MKHPRSFTAILVLGALAGTPCLGRADDQKLSPSAKAGRQEFNTYCVPCHGEDAKGHGVAAAALKQQPADLTLIAARHGGKFDAVEVAEMIDGRMKSPAHGTREMPIWGKHLGDDAADRDDEESLVQGRLALLVAYLQTIQAPGPTGAEGAKEK